MFTSNFTFSSKQCSRVTAQHSDNWLKNKKYYPLWSVQLSIYECKHGIFRLLTRKLNTDVDK